MTHNESDVLAVRSLAAEPTDASVTRSWYRITQLEAKRHKVSRRRFLIPVAAGVALTVLAGGTAFFLTRPNGGGDYLPGTPIEPVTALDVLATAAENTQPVTIAEGQLIYTETEGWAATFSGGGTTGVMEPQPREEWFDPNGGIMVRSEADGVDFLAGMKSNFQAEIDSARALLAAQGPSLRQPTLAWIAGLPTDPAQLLTVLRSHIQPHDSWSKDQQLWDAMGGFYRSFEIALSPHARAALLRSFKGIDGLNAREITLDGRNLIAIRFVEKEHGDEILFDPITGRAVGRSSLFFGEMTLTQPATGAVTDQYVTYVATWAQEIVDQQ